MNPLSPLIRAAIGLTAVFNLVLGWAFVRQMSWALDLWPTETGRLTYIFIGSILIAIAAGAGWIAISGERGSLPAGFLNLVVLTGGIGGYLLIQGARTDQGDWVAYGIVGLVLAAVNFVLFLRTRDTPIREPRPLPWLVRGSYVVFTAVLLMVGGAMILQRADIMPWPVDSDTSTLIGWIFFGNAFYFLYAVLRPTWQTARAQLWSFLAYDVILIWPLIDHIATVTDTLPNLRSNLYIYIAILVYSAALAIFYLLINPRTRTWRAPSLSPREQPQS
jgi:hypothetical protein